MNDKRTWRSNPRLFHVALIKPPPLTDADGQPVRTPAPWTTTQVPELRAGATVHATALVLDHRLRARRLPPALQVAVLAIATHADYMTMAAHGITTEAHLTAAVRAVDNFDRLIDLMRVFKPDSELEYAQLKLRLGEIYLKIDAACEAYRDWEQAKRVRTINPRPAFWGGCLLIESLHILARLGHAGTPEFTAARAQLLEVVEEVPEDLASAPVGFRPKPALLRR